MVLYLKGKCLNTFKSQG